MIKRGEINVLMSIPNRNDREKDGETMERQRKPETRAGSRRKALSANGRPISQQIKRGKEKRSNPRVAGTVENRKKKKSKKKGDGPGHLCGEL